MSLTEGPAFAQASEARRTAQHARGLALSGQCAEAIPVFNRAINLEPVHPELLRDRGAFVTSSVKAVRT